MKKNRNYLYAEISSFEDFRLERERLNMKLELVEIKINHSYLRIIQIFSFTTALAGLAKEFVLPRISSLLGWLLNKVKDNT